MLLIPIKNLPEGTTELELSFESDVIENLIEEYNSSINLVCKLTKLGNQIEFKSIVSTKANLVCDYSLENFEQNINISLNLIFKLNVSKTEKELFFDEDNIIFYNNDDNDIDISQHLREELIMALPMKRISPNYKDKNFEDLFPEFIKENIAENNPFAKLKDLKLNK